MRVLLFGAGGMLARDLVSHTPPSIEVVPHPRSATDVTSEQQVAAALRDARPDLVINCAAYTNVDRAESESAVAFAVNGEGPAIIGRAVERWSRETRVVHYSTDYVFNGRSTLPYGEEDGPDPLGAYGASKLAGERALAASGARYLIIRTQWLFGLTGRSFPRTMWDRARAGQATRVVNDQRGRPTYTVDLARSTWLLFTGEASRERIRPVTILHVANAGSATWYDVASRVFEAAAAGRALTACGTADYPSPAPRPVHSVLDTTRFESVSGDQLPSWQDAVDRFLDQLRAEEASR